VLVESPISYADVSNTTIAAFAAQLKTEKLVNVPFQRSETTAARRARQLETHFAHTV
jgi:hypothetical protein